MAVQTFGVDQTHVSSFEPQIEVATDAPVTPTRLTVMINASAARINGLMSFHGLDPDVIAADSLSVGFSNARRLITERTLVDLRAAAYGGVSVASEIATYDARAEDQIEKWQAKPDSLGADVTNDVSPGVHTSTQALGLDTSERCRAGRRRYDRVRCRNSLPNDGSR